MGCEHANKGQVLVGEGHADRVIAVVNCPDHFHGRLETAARPFRVLSALFGPRVFDTVKNTADMSTPQEAPTTGETKTP